MDNTDWDKFFELLSQIVNTDSLNYVEKARKVQDEADKRGEQTQNDLEEFLSWW